MPARSEFLITATLLDGTEATLRNLHPEDYDAVVSLAVYLSAEERYQRFFTVHPTYITDQARGGNCGARGISIRRVDRRCQLCRADPTG